jgi:purine-binding chemotaxis protein CheW
MDQQELLEELEDTQRGRFLTFNLEEEVFGMEIRFVKEIIDMRLKLKKPAAEYTDRTCIIVVETTEVTVGLI